MSFRKVLPDDTQSKRPHTAKATKFSRRLKDRGPPIFIMITKPLNLPGSNSDSSSTFSIMEALRRQSGLAPSEHASTTPGTISTMQTWASIVANDLALDLRTTAIKPPGLAGLSVCQQPPSAQGSRELTALGDPEYRKAIARLSLQIRELETAHARSVSADSNVALVPYRTFPPRVTARRMSHRSMPKHVEERRDSSRFSKTFASPRKTLSYRTRVSRETTKNLAEDRFVKSESASMTIPRDSTPEVDSKEKGLEELCPIFEEEGRLAPSTYSSEREIPDIVQELLEATYRSGYDTDKPQLQIEDALIPLNNLIEQQRRAAYNAGSILGDSDADIDSTPCPPMAEIRNRRRRRQFRQVGGISRSEVLSNLTSRKHKRLTQSATNVSDTSAIASSKRSSVFTLGSSASSTYAFDRSIARKNELEQSERSFETTSTKRHGVIFDSLTFRPLELDLLKSVYP